MFLDLLPRLGQRAARHASAHEPVAPPAHQRPARMPRVPRPAAVARRLAALAPCRHQAAGAEVADRRQLAEQVVAAAFEFVHILGIGHGVDFLSHLYL